MVGTIGRGSLLDLNAKIDAGLRPPFQLRIPSSFFSDLSFLAAIIRLDLFGVL